MSYAIAAAGTGGHVYPGLAVGEALTRRGVPAEDVLYVGGARLEAEVYPAAGFPFQAVELRGLERSLTLRNLTLPLVVGRAVRRLVGLFESRRVEVVLGMGGYVTVPAGLAARRAGARLALCEQNAEAGLANRVMAGLASRCFGSFPETSHLRRAEWVGNPVRSDIAELDRSRLRPDALARYQLDADRPVLGVFGGSLGAQAINRAVVDTLRSWDGPEMQVIHLAGVRDHDWVAGAARDSALTWRVVAFEERMDLFYAAAELVVARAGGAVAELTATATPAILVPGGFGSAGHQEANAAALGRAGAAVVLPEAELGRLDEVLAGLVADDGRRRAMADAAASLARPDAADRIAAALEELHG